MNDGTPHREDFATTGRLSLAVPEPSSSPGRRRTIGALAEAHGGSLESFYFAFGDVDVFLIVDMPDNATAAALALAVSASGVVGIETTVLLTPEEMDTATGIEVDYRPPGG